MRHLLIIDQNDLAAEAACQRLQASGEFYVCDVVQSIQAAHNIKDDCSPEIILADLKLTECASLKTLFPEACVLVYSHAERVYSKPELRMMGICGFASKTEPFSEVLRGLRILSHSNDPEVVFMSAHSLAAIQASEKAGPHARLHRLTKKEKIVAAMIGRGLHSASIADECGIAETTVRVHKLKITRKLELSSLRKTGITNIQSFISKYFPDLDSFIGETKPLNNSGERHVIF